MSYSKNGFLATGTGSGGSGGAGVAGTLDYASSRTVGASAYNITSTTYVDYAPGGTALTTSISKATSTSDVLILLSWSGYQNTATSFTIGVQVDGTTDTDMIAGFFNTVSQHQGFTAARVVSGLASGTHTFKVRWKTTSGTLSSDQNDTVSISVIEVGTNAVPGSGGVTYASASIGMPQGTRARQYTFTNDTQSFTVDSGTLSMSNGRLILTGVSSPSGNHSALEPSTASNVADGELVVDFQGVTALSTNYIDAGLIFRGTDANNHYMVTLRLGTNNGTFSSMRPFELYKKVSGTYTTLLGSSEAVTYENRWPYIDVTAPIRAMVRFVGNAISLYVNETYVAGWTDSTYTTGLVGVRLSSNGSAPASVAAYDNVTVYTLSNPWTPYDYSPQGTASVPLIGTPEVVTTANSSTAYTIPEPLTSSITNLTLTANTTLTFPTLASGKSFTVALTQDSTGSRTVTWPGTVKWPNGTAPTLTTTAGKTDLLSFVSIDGVSWLGSVTKGF